MATEDILRLLLERFPLFAAAEGVAKDVLAFLTGKITEVEGKLPPGTVLAEEDLKNIIAMAVGKFGPKLLTDLGVGLFIALRDGKGPNEFDPTFHA